MRWTDKRESRTVEYQTLKGGDAFLWSGNLYLKLGREFSGFSSVDMRSGAGVNLTSTCPVYPVEPEVIIKGD